MKFHSQEIRRDGGQRPASAVNLEHSKGILCDAVVLDWIWAGRKGKATRILRL